jgi:hypothetical protein
MDEPDLPASDKREGLSPGAGRLVAVRIRAGARLTPARTRSGFLAGGSRRIRRSVGLAVGTVIATVNVDNRLSTRKRELRQPCPSSSRYAVTRRGGKAGPSAT